MASRRFTRLTNGFSKKLETTRRRFRVIDGGKA
jgi:hypothetical protein